MEKIIQTLEQLPKIFGRNQYGDEFCVKGIINDATGERIWPKAQFNDFIKNDLEYNSGYNYLTNLNPEFKPYSISGGDLVSPPDGSIICFLAIDPRGDTRTCGLSALSRDGTDAIAINQGSIWGPYMDGILFSDLTSMINRSNKNTGLYSFLFLVEKIPSMPAFYLRSIDYFSPSSNSIIVSRGEYVYIDHNDGSAPGISYQIFSPIEELLEKPKSTRSVFSLASSSMLSLNPYTNFWTSALVTVDSNTMIKPWVGKLPSYQIAHYSKGEEMSANDIPIIPYIFTPPQGTGITEEYVITFDPNGGEFSEEFFLQSNGSNWLRTKWQRMPKMAPNPVFRGGHVFLGWSLNGDTTIGWDAFIFSKDLTLTAEWAPV